MRYYKVVTKSTHMPSSVISSGAYRKIALMELDSANCIPTMISLRARGVRRILEEHDRVHVGTTERSWGVQLLRRLRAEAERLNAEPPIPSDLAAIRMAESKSAEAVR